MPQLIRIVIADDDEDDTEMFKSAAIEICPSAEVIVADNGVQLLTLLSKIPKPDIILLDLNMPLKTGKECLEELRAKEDFDAIPIAILSTSKSKQDMEFCLKKGADHYFVKPNSIDGIMLIVHSIFSRWLHHIH